MGTEVHWEEGEGRHRKVWDDYVRLSVMLLTKKHLHLPHTIKIFFNLYYSQMIIWKWMSYSTWQTLTWAYVNCGRELSWIYQIFTLCQKSMSLMSLVTVWQCGYHRENFQISNTASTPKSVEHHLAITISNHFLPSNSLLWILENQFSHCTQWVTKLENSVLYKCRA